MQGKQSTEVIKTLRHKVKYHRLKISSTQIKNCNKLTTKNLIIKHFMSITTLIINLIKNYPKQQSLYHHNNNWHKNNNSTNKNLHKFNNNVNLYNKKSKQNLTNKNNKH